MKYSENQESISCFVVGRPRPEYGLLFGKAEPMPETMHGSKLLFQKYTDKMHLKHQ
ncbi:hypothetical protein [Desulfocicer vacuolatum]|uniref:hypothetical protein n=1 Tax=Desulfocicer vacuolatum TaxID=2298 RepID=UPI001BB016A7|nr:hypothetical protein [Desulfocicer vacuolatum]